MNLPTPTYTRAPVDAELQRWSRIYEGDEYYYGDEPGPIARRAVRYHRHFARRGAAALDAGCGEGQDLAYLAEIGYSATGIEFTDPGFRKSRALLQERGLEAEVLQEDLRAFTPTRQYDLVLAVNTIQFLGQDASACLDRLIEATAPGGVIGLSLFARESESPPISGTIWFITFQELLERFQRWQCMEAARLWQWNVATNEPQPFVTLIARKAPPSAGTGSLLQLK